jgi:hypothetical protein
MLFVSVLCPLPRAPCVFYGEQAMCHLDQLFPFNCNLFISFDYLVFPGGDFPFRDGDFGNKWQLFGEKW